jgi:hypothetical protein
MLAAEMGVAGTAPLLSLAAPRARAFAGGAASCACCTSCCGCAAGLAPPLLPAPSWSEHALPSLPQVMSTRGTLPAAACALLRTCAARRHSHVAPLPPFAMLPSSRGVASQASAAGIAAGLARAHERSQRGAATAGCRGCRCVACALMPAPACLVSPAKRKALPTDQATTSLIRPAGQALISRAAPGDQSAGC